MKLRIGIVLFIAGSLPGCSGSTSDNKESTIPVETSVNELPSMVVTLLNGTNVDMKGLKDKAILIVFRPDCDHCQREAMAIEENLDAFVDHSLYFITSDPMPEIERFANDYKLTGHANVFFGWTSVENVLNNFGSVSTPSIYMYSSEHKLIKSFNGEVNINQVLAFL